MEKKLSRLDRLKLDMVKYRRPAGTPSVVAQASGKPRTTKPSAAQGSTGVRPLSDKAASAIAEALRLMMSGDRP